MMDKDHERLGQLLKERCPGANIKDDDVKKLVDAGYDIETALAATVKENLVAVLSERRGVVGVLLKAFVEPAGMFCSQGFPVMMLILGAVIMDMCDFRV